MRLAAMIVTILGLGAGDRVHAQPHFFVSDESAKSVFAYDASHSMTQQISTESAGSDKGRGTGADDQYVYVLDDSDRRIYRFTHDGTLSAVSRTLRTNTGSELNVPSGLEVLSMDDEVWVVNNNGSSSAAYRYVLSSAFGAGGNLNAAQAISLGSSCDDPEGLAMDDTYIYVLDDDSDRFFRFIRTGGVGTQSRKLRRSGGTSVGSVLGASLDTEGGIMWVTDESNNRILKYPLASLDFGVSGNVNASSEVTLHGSNSDAEGLALVPVNCVTEDALY